LHSSVDSWEKDQAADAMPWCWPHFARGSHSGTEIFQLGMEANACNPSITGGRRIWIWGQPWLHSEILFQRQINRQLRFCHLPTWVGKGVQDLTKRKEETYRQCTEG
jgi:hypothetical protein